MKKIIAIIFAMLFIVGCATVGNNTDEHKNPCQEPSSFCHSTK